MQVTLLVTFLEFSRTAWSMSAAVLPLPAIGLFAAKVQHRALGADLAEDIRPRTRHENVSRISAIHYALSDVDAATCDIPIRIDVSDAVDRSSVDAHPKRDVGPGAERLGNLDRATYRCLGVREEHHSGLAHCPVRDGKWPTLIEIRTL